MSEVPLYLRVCGVGEHLEGASDVARYVHHSQQLVVPCQCRDKVLRFRVGISGSGFGDEWFHVPTERDGIGGLRK